MKQQYVVGVSYRAVLSSGDRDAFHVLRSCRRGDRVSVIKQRGGNVYIAFRRLTDAELAEAIQDDHADTVICGCARCEAKEK